MVSLEEYLSNPCGTLSIPFWKAETIRLPDNMRIIHQSRFFPESFAEYTDEPYFRLYHDLQAIPKPDLPQIELLPCKRPDDMVSLINGSYIDLQVDRRQIESYTKTPVYAPDLWLLATEKNTGKIVGGGIADYHKETGELILEWIQVLPEYRRKGIGRAIVTELLARKQGAAQFATVSGKANNPDNPEALYRACGFTGQDIWHVLRKK